MRRAIDIVRRALPAALLLVAPATLRAQIRASEAASVSQTVDGTKITIEYSRPMARGRDTLFGKQVKWGHTWTPGANWATTLEADKDIRLNGHPVPKGKYSVWMIPRRDSAWTVILSRMARRFHAVPPPDTAEQLRFDVRPEQAPAMETLSWYFPTFAPDGAALRMHWGTTSVPLRIGVDPSKPVALGDEERRAHVGTYVMRATASGRADTLEVLEAEGRLRGRWTRVLADYDQTFDLIPIAPGQFRPLLYRGGKPFDTEDFTFAFKPAGGRKTTFEMLGVAGRAIATGERIK